MLTTSALQKIREFIKKNLAYGRYRIGTTYYKVPIQSIEIVGGAVAVYLLIDHSAVGTVNQIQLFDYGNEVFAEKTESIVKNGTQGVLAKFTFLVQEV